jgi:SP family myo-inositol transporter-like MFS transporter 13
LPSTGVISATLVAIRTSLSDRPLTAADKSLITSATSLFALLASPLAAPLADALGRRRALLAADLAFAIGCAAQAVARSVTAMAAGRALVGAGLGVASTAAPLLVGESCPARLRGRLVAMQVLAVTAGQVVAYAMGWAMVGGVGAKEGAWRPLVALGALPAVLQAAMLFAGAAPESPRWLVGKGKGAEARRVLERVYGGGPAAGRLVARLEREVGEERAEGGVGAGSALMELFRRPDNRRALGVACMLQAAQQLCGFVCFEPSIRHG